MSHAEATSDSVLDQAAAGYRSSLLSHAIRVACKALGIVVLARLVTPADHGLFAMAATLMLLLVLFRDLGLGAAAIQVRALDEEQRTTLWHAHAALGLFLGALMLSLAPALGAFFNEPAVVPLAATVSASLVLIGLNAWPRVLLARDLRFAELNRLETWGAAIGTAAMIATAALQGGAYAFAVFLLVSEFVCLITAWRICRWRPTARARWSSIRPLWRSGTHLLGHNVLHFLLQQIDTLLMGRWFGATALGFYNRPNQLLALPLTHVATPLTQVLMASLSRLPPDSPDFAKHVRQTANLLAYLTLPLAAIGIVAPDEVVRLLLGQNWPEAAPLLRWLAVSAAASYLTTTVYAVCLASAHTGRLLALSAASLLATAGGLWIGRTHGPVGLAAALAMVNAALLLPRLWIATRHTPVRLRDYFSAFSGPLALATASMTALALSRLAAADLPWLPRLALTAIGGLLGAALVVASSKHVRAELLHVWQHRPFAPRPTQPSRSA